MRSLLRPLLVTVVLGALVTSCGGDDDDASDATETTTTTISSYVERMEAACDERDRAFNDLVQPIPDEFTPDYVDHVVRGSVEVISTYLEAVREIGAPGDGLDDDHAAYLVELEAVLDRYVAAVGDEAASAAVFNQPNTAVPAIEQRLGLPTCGTRGNGLDAETEETS